MAKGTFDEVDDATNENVRAFFKIIDSLLNLHGSLERLDKDLRESKTSNERVKTIMSGVNVQRSNLLGVEKRVKWLKEDFSKHELDTLKKMITNLKEEEYCLKPKVRRLDIEFGKSVVKFEAGIAQEFEDGIKLKQEEVIGECK